MQVGELFVNVGLMGADKLAKGLETANKSLNQIKETGLESAFRLKSVFGQFEQQVSTFSNMGTVLKVFEDQTGLSAVTLQKFQRAFMGVNVSADETRATMLNLQNIMNTIQRGGAVPAAMSEALRRLNIDITQIKDVPGFIEKMTKVSKTMDIGIGRDIAKDLGMSGTFWQGMRDYSGDFAKEQAWLNESQIRASAKMSAKIETMRRDIEAAFAKLISTPAASKALDAMYKIIMSFVNLLETVAKIANKTDIIEQVTNFLTILTGFIASILQIILSIVGEAAGTGKNKQSTTQLLLEEQFPLLKIIKGATGMGAMDIFKSESDIVKGMSKAATQAITNNVIVNQTITSPDPATAAKKSKEGFVTATKNISTRVQK